MGAVFAACGNDVWVGNFAMCDERHTGFDRIIHVHHELSPTPGRCKAFEAQGPGGLFVRYVDGTSLSAAEIANPLDYEKRGAQNVPIIAGFASKPGRLLCHCAAGLCRGPTMAIIAKIARGCTPWQAAHDVSQAMWLGYRQHPQLFCVPLNEICGWYWEGAVR